MKPNLVIEPQNIFLSDAHNRAIVAIEGVGVRDHRVQIVVPACELQNNDYGLFGLCCDDKILSGFPASVYLALKRFGVIYANWYSLSDTIN